jgi:quinol-cytochrome oxidoreductase complex cytochrome b subunit
MTKEAININFRWSVLVCYVSVVLLLLLKYADPDSQKSSSISGVEEDRRLRLDDRQGLWQQQHSILHGK